MVSKRVYSVVIISILVLALVSLISADYYFTTPASSPAAVAFQSPTLAYNCSYTNNSYLAISFTGYLLNFSAVVGNLTIYTYNATGGIFNVTNVTSPYVGGMINVSTPDGIYNISMNLSNVTFSNTTAMYNITVDTKNPNMTLTYPVANANLSFYNITINSSSRDINLNDTVITVYTSGRVQVGNSVVLTGNNNASVNFTSDGMYSIFATAYDRAGNSNTTSANITVDITPPVIIVYSPLNNTNYYANQLIKVSFAATELSPFNYWYSNDTSGAPAANITTTAGNLTATVNYTTAGWYNLTFSVNDSSAHLTTLRIMIDVLTQNGSTVLANTSSNNLTVNDTMSTIIVPYNSSLQNVTMANTSQVVVFDLSQLLANNSVTAGNSFSLLSAGGAYNYTVYIPQYTNVTGASASWNGKINLPTINNSAFTAPSSGATNAVIDTGSVTSLNFSNPVEVIIGGMGGKSAAWTTLGSSTLTDISTICNSGNSTNAAVPTNINSNSTRECYMGDGSDLIIWTYHFTSFAAYTPYVAPVVAATNAGGGSVSTATPTNLTQGVSKTFSTGDVLTFPFDSRTYMFIMVYTKGSSAIIQFSPNLQQATLATGEEKDFDLNKDGKNDIAVTVNSVSGITADVTLKLITETAPVETPVAPETGVGALVSQTAQKIAAWSLTKKITVIVGIIIAVALVVLGIIFLRKKSTNSRAREHVKTFEFARK